MLASLQRTYEDSRGDLSFDQFHALIRREDPGLAHLDVFLDGKLPRGDVESHKGKFAL